MIALLQRVLRAEVRVEEQRIAAIEQGILALIGVERDDRPASADRLLERILTYRLFADGEGRMNRHLGDVRGGLLLVPQFTLAADTRKGTRPGFSTAAAPEAARALFGCLVDAARARHSPVATGEFGAHMRVELVNDGPATVWLEASASP
ncbi:MAG: D-aminoacyl-tRNA deacylase [Steroidobacteraceae bacterium]